MSSSALIIDYELFTMSPVLIIRLIVRSVRARAGSFLFRPNDQNLARYGGGLVEIAASVCVLVVSAARTEAGSV